MMRLHATCVELSGAAVLLRGPSGSGKSDLALRLIDGGGRLVSDDWTEIEARGGRLFARAPAAIAGLLEVRGVGILRFPTVPESPVALVADLVAPGSVERLPEPADEEMLDCRLARVAISAFEASADVKLRLAVAAVQDKNLRHA